MTKFIRFLSILFIIAAVAAIAGTAAVLILNKPPENMPEETVFRVSKGENGSVIGKNLEEQGLIRSSAFFIAYIRFKNTAGMMKSGLYRINGGASCVEIHNTLLYGAEELFRVAIPPGLTSRNISEILENEDITKAEDFLSEVDAQNAEGFLFPDTYSFPKEYPADRVVEVMTDNFNTAAVSVYPEYENMNDDQKREKVIMASIIEREYRNRDEAGKIASVFYNRIEKNMYLGSCATIVYIITEEQGKTHPEKLLYRDLEIKSPFNTYINKGLPPGPICNPGLTAIDAALNPEETDYLYFLLEDPETGTHMFSRSLAEHNRSYELYIKGK